MIWNWMESSNTRYGWMVLITHWWTEVQGRCLRDMCVFRVFLGTSDRLGTVFWIHLLFLMDETVYKKMLNSPLCSSYLLIQQLEQTCPSVIAELTACCILTPYHLSTALIKTEKKTKKIIPKYQTRNSLINRS